MFNIANKGWGGLRRFYLRTCGDLFLKRIDFKRVPLHVAIIMDGNGRWAKKRGLPRIAGHREGIKSIREVVKAAAEAKIKYLTVYTFSVENWRRPKEEVTVLMNLLEETLKKERDELNKNGVKVNIVGELKQLPESTQKECQEIMELTKDNSNLNLNIALNYGGRTEIAQAVQKIVQEVKEGKEKLNSISINTISEHLYTKGMPDPELLIRTSGEFRVSNFLLWQIAYTEFWITPVLWPDFNRYHFFKALLEFQKRKRRFGGLQDL